MSQSVRSSPEIDSPAPGLAVSGLDLRVGHGEPRVLAFVQGGLDRESPEAIRAIRAELRGLGAELVVVSPAGVWRVRADDPIEPAAGDALAAEVAAAARRFGVTAGDDAVFVIDGRGVVRFSYRLPRPTEAVCARLAAALAIAGRAVVRVARVVAAYAAGKILNPRTARSQLEGGIVWGISMALHENMVRDRRTARAVTRDLADYHVPVHADVPDLDVTFIDEPDPFVNPLGVKGIGEIGITGVVAALANAVYHATGRRVRDLPITLDKLL